MAETRHHHGRFLAATRQPADAPADAPVPRGHRRPAARPAAGRQRARARSTTPNDYAAAQALGARLHAAGSAGVAYRSVRHAARAVRGPVQAARCQPLPARRLPAVRLGRRSASATSTRRPHEAATAALRPPRRAARRGHRLDGGLPPLLRPQPLRPAGAAPELLSRPVLDQQRTAIVSLFLLCAGLGQAVALQAGAGLAALLAPLGAGGRLRACW